MIHIPKCRPLIVGALFLLVLLAPAQTQQRAETLSIEPYPGDAKVMRSEGRVFVEVGDLARITNGSLRFEGNRIILTLPSDVSASVGNKSAKTGFSRPFMKAAIEAMASIREWGRTLQVVVQNGYPVGNTTSGTTTMAFQGRAADSVALASAATSTDSDYRGLELLRNELNNVQAWSDAFVIDRSSMSAANLTMSETALKDDQEAQKIVHCGQFLAQMFASGTFQDDVACH